jgi:hypothetical protein
MPEDFEPYEWEIPSGDIAAKLSLNNPSLMQR